MKNKIKLKSFDMICKVIVISVLSPIDFYPPMYQKPHLLILTMSFIVYVSTDNPLEFALIIRQD